MSCLTEGGYAFPGSSSEIDLHSLTGWVPEVIDMTSSSFTPERREREWQRMLRGLEFGDCLLCVSTGDLDPDQAEELGLVTLHAYAVLDVRTVNGLRLIQLKVSNIHFPN